MMKNIQICWNLGHGKGQLLAKHTIFLQLHYHPHGKKYPNLLKSWGMERVNFWLSVRCFGIFTITLSAKNIQICWNLGAWKGSTFGSAYNIRHLYYHLLGEKYPNLLKSWGIKRVNFWLSVRCFGIFTITLSAKNIQICWNHGASKWSTFDSAYVVLASSLSPSRRKISKFAEILGHGKGQLLAQRTMFLRLHYHPHGEKYPNLLKSWGMERVYFWLSIRCFYIFTINPMVKNIQTCWNLGALKRSTFGSA